MKTLWQILVALCTLQWGTLVLAAETSHALPKLVVTSIAPIEGMVKPIFPEQTKIKVLLRAGEEPHTYQLRPSQMLAIQQAGAVLGLGTEADLWMQKSVQHKSSQQVLWMKDVPGVVLYPTRDEHGHHHAHHPEALQGHEDHAGVDPTLDPHIWLSPQNAQAFVQAVAQRWSLPQQKVKAWQMQLQQADQAVAKRLKPVQKVPFVVLHDAFQYFERHYGLNNVGVIQLNASVKPSIRRVLKMRKLIQQKGVKCIITEPQFPQRQLRAVTEGLNVKVVGVDPLNSQHLPYDQFLRQIAHDFKGCLQ